MKKVIILFSLIVTIPTISQAGKRELRRLKRDCVNNTSSWKAEAKCFRRGIEDIISSRKGGGRKVTALPKCKVVETYGWMTSLDRPPSYYEVKINGMVKKRVNNESDAFDWAESYQRQGLCEGVRTECLKIYSTNGAGQACERWQQY
jgi:hypothetical protein